MALGSPAHLYCLAVGIPLSTEAPREYRGLARRTLFDVLLVLEDRTCTEILPATDDCRQLREAYEHWLGSGFDLAPLPDSDGCIAEVMEIVRRMSRASVPDEWRCAFETVVAVKCVGSESAAEVMSMGRSYAASFAVMASTELQLLGFDLVEECSSWSALANITDWHGPAGSLNKHGLCDDMEQMTEVRDLYFRCDDPDRISPEEYSLWGVIRTSLLDRLAG
jgi:hypothetical protein